MRTAEVHRRSGFTTAGFMNNFSALEAVRIVGVGTTVQARDLRPRDDFSVAFEAIELALADGGVTFSDVDGMSSALRTWPLQPGESRVRAEQFWARQLGRPLRWLGVHHGAHGVMEASAAIAAGFASTVVVVAGQVQPPRPAEQREESKATVSWVRSPDEFTEWTGAYTAAEFALVAQRYVHQYGESALRAMAEVSATIRNFGRLNPDAVYFDRPHITADDVLASRMIATPLTLLMCAGVNDGASAFIVTTAERARDLRKPPIRVIAGADQQPYTMHYDVPFYELPVEPSWFARDAFARAGIAPSDLDMAQLYDSFSITALGQLELFGICETGGAVEFVNQGATRLGGSLPICTDGGLHAYSHNGKPPNLRVIEAVRQLRGEVKDPCPGWAKNVHSHVDGECRAVPDPELALAASYGTPTGGGAFVVLGREG